jgi:putative transposase
MQKSSSNCGPSACTTTKRSTGSSGNGKAVTAHTCGRRWGGKENGPNPTDRAKPGMKDHVLVDGRGVPLSLVVSAANVNDHIALPELLNNHAVVRPRPTCAEPQHICLDAAFDNEPTRQTLCREYYVSHIAPKGGRPEDSPQHPGGQARRWVVERTHAWFDRFRRLVVNWEKTTESRYAFLCLASALIAYRI